MSVLDMVVMCNSDPIRLDSGNSGVKVQDFQLEPRGNTTPRSPIFYGSTLICFTNSKV